ncbi:MAG: muconolactone Delta-isomerase [Chloroflexales bacterium]|nr:muconolactone Delta-isomerase [Chloroflexales bacterium]
MLFHVEMEVQVPHDIDPAVFEDLKAREKARAQELQRQGIWRHLWRVVGRYANISIFDVADAEQLHSILIDLPLFPYMTVTATVLCHHPSSIHLDDK